MRPSLVAILALHIPSSVACLAQQQDVCGIRTVAEAARPHYPTIARAAHVEGNVIMLVDFKTTGEVERVEVVSGPEMLRSAATDYVKKWRANESSGPRICPIVVRFVMFREGDKDRPEVVRSDLQHVTVYDQRPLIQPSYAATR